MNWKGRRVFVTGGAGFIGSHLVGRLANLGASLGLFIHINETPVSAKRHYGNLSEFPNNLIHFLRRFDPEIIFHLAAQPLVTVALGDEVETFRTNVDGTYNLLHACRELKNLRAFVHVSTDKVYGEYEEPVLESMELRGVKHPYNSSKLCGDAIAQTYAHSYGLPVIISRSGNIYGAGDKNFSRLVPGTVLATLKGENLVVRSDGKMIRDYIHVDDIVDGYLLLAEVIAKNRKWAGRAINFGAKEPLSVLDVVHEVLGEMNRIDLRPQIENTAKLEIPYQHLDWGLAKGLGWEPKTDLQSGLKKTIPWYVEMYKNEKKTSNVFV